VLVHLLKICLTFLLLVLIIDVVCLSVVFCLPGALVDSQTDHNAAETGFGAAGVGGHGKYFQ